MVLLLISSDMSLEAAAAATSSVCKSPSPIAGTVEVATTQVLVVVVVVEVAAVVQNG